MKRILKTTGGVALGASVLAAICVPTGGVVNASAWTDVANDVDVVIITDSNREKWFNTRLPNNDTTETYHPASRTFQAMPTIECTGNRLWAGIWTGGVTEPDPNSYCVVMYSDDQGKTWVDPFIMLVNKNGQINDTPMLWVDPDGELHLFFNGKRARMSEIVIHNADGPINQITVSAPRTLYEATLANEPIACKDGSWMAIVSKAGATNEVVVLRSTDKGETWEEYSTIRSIAENKKFPEAEIVEISEGTFWCIARIERGQGGGMERAVSTDGGKTWTNFVPDLGEPYVSPGSKADFVSLKNGDLLLTTNAAKFISTFDRRNMTTYLSQDHGQTWHKLLLDDRSFTSYPQSCEDNRGNIYIVYDHSRCKLQSDVYPSMDIRMAKLTREDIIAGKYDMFAQNTVIVKNKDYHEIIEPLNYLRVLTVKKGTTEEEMLSFLPQYPKVKMDDGRTYTLTGQWKTAFNAAQPYKAVFEAELEENFADTYKILEVTVNYGDQNDDDSNVGGDRGALIGGIVGGVGAVVLAGGIAMAAIAKKRDNDKDKEE